MQAMMLESVLTACIALATVAANVGVVIAGHRPRCIQTPCPSCPPRRCGRATTASRVGPPSAGGR